MTAPVKFFSSAMPGAPVLNGVAGSRLAVLSACLVDGWGLNALSSLVINNNVLTGTLNSHPYVVGQVIEIAGVTTPAAANGQFVVSSVTTNNFSCAVSGISNQTAAGAPTAKVAAAGWSKPFSGTNKAVFRPTAATSNKPCLRVLDTGAQLARVNGYTSMTTVDAGSNIFPTAAQLNGGTYWPCSSAANSTARPWIVVADDRLFYFWRSVDGWSSPLNCIDAFGEFPSEKAGDAYNCLLTGDINNFGLTTSMMYAVDGSGNYAWAPREYTQTGSAIQLEYFRGNNAGVFGVGSGNGGVTYPSPVSGGLILSQPSIPVAGAQAGLRCAGVPGLFFTPQNQPLTHGDLVTNVPGLAGKTLLAIDTRNSGGNGRVFIDLTGPWR